MTKGAKLTKAEAEVIIRRVMWHMDEVLDSWSSMSREAIIAEALESLGYGDAFAGLGLPQDGSR